MTTSGFVPPDPQVIADRFGFDSVKPIRGDASRRTYYRGHKNAKSFVVMAYPEASKENLDNLRASIQKSETLAEQNIKTSKCLEVDEGNVCAVLEDLGEVSFGDCLRNSLLSAEKLYSLATQNLIKMRDIKNKSQWLPYKKTHLYANRRQLIDYYMAYKLGQRSTKQYVEEFQDIWKEIESGLPPCPQGFVHGDYHLENLMLVKDEAGEYQGAVIDNQDAFYGPLPYDLVNLLEDARTDVPVSIRSKMIRLYTKNMSAKESEVFKTWYTVLAMQFHGRVIGLFIKFAAENNNDAYLEHVPRLQKYIVNSLEEPVLRPLKVWFEKVKLDFSNVTPLDGDHIRAVLK